MLYCLNIHSNNSYYCQVEHYLEGNKKDSKMAQALNNETVISSLHDSHLLLLRRLIVLF